MTLLFPIIVVFVVSFVLARLYLPVAPASQRLNVLVVAKWAVALACAIIAASGQPEMWSFAVLFGIFAWRTKAGEPSIANGTSAPSCG